MPRSLPRCSRTRSAPSAARRSSITPRSISRPSRVRTYDDIAATVALFDHTIDAGQFSAAWQLYENRLRIDLVISLNLHTRAIELLRRLFVDGEDRPPRLTSAYERFEASARLAELYSSIGDYRRALALLRQPWLSPCAEAALHLGMLEAASRYCAEAAELRTGDSHWSGHVYLVSSNICKTTGRHDLARADQAKAADLFRRSHSNDRIHRSMIKKAESNVASDPDTAVEVARAAVAIVEDAREKAGRVRWRRTHLSRGAGAGRRAVPAARRIGSSQRRASTSTDVEKTVMRREHVAGGAGQARHGQRGTPP
jgi:tetratricopeptide (TPR) repeat protein